MTIQAKEERTFTTIPCIVEVVEVSAIGTMRKRFFQYVCSPHREVCDCKDSDFL